MFSFVHRTVELRTAGTRADPATEEELGTVPEMGLEETKLAIDAASRAFKTWSKTTGKVRPPCAAVCAFLLV